MKKLLSNRYFRIFAMGVMVSLFLNSGFIISEWYAVQPNGSTTGLWAQIFLFLPLLLALLGVLLGIVLLIPRRTRKLAMSIVIFGAVYVVVGVACGRIGAKLRMYEFGRLAEHSNSLVLAIGMYEKDHGYPPAVLTDLVPEYLKEIPTTGMAAYPDYEYYVGEQAQTYENNHWILMVQTPSGGINFDMFVYFPNGNYPKRAYSSWMERVGDWAYYHE